MGVVNTLSTAITNGDATPKVLNQPYYDAGLLRSSVGTVEVAAADSDTSTYRFVRIPSGARIQSIRVFCDAITAGTSFDCGIYKTAADGGAVVSAAVFASAVDLSSAITAGTEIAFEARDIANVQKRVWEDLSLSVDPFIDYDVVLTANTVGSAAGTITLQVTYVV